MGPKIRVSTQSCVPVNPNDETVVAAPQKHPVGDHVKSSEVKSSLGVQHRRSTLRETNWEAEGSQRHMRLTPSSMSRASAASALVSSTQQPD